VVDVLLRDHVAICLMPPDRQMFWFWVVLLILMCTWIFVIAYTLMREEETRHGLSQALLLRWRQ
jgi:hypothetical protein